MIDWYFVFLFKATTTKTTTTLFTPNSGTVNNLLYDWYIYDSSKGYVKSTQIKFVCFFFKFEKK